MTPRVREPAPAWAHEEIARLRAALAQARARVEELEQRNDRHELAWAEAIDQLGGKHAERKN